MNFDLQLQQVLSSGLAGPVNIEINLADVKSDQELRIAGNYFYVKESPDQTSYVQVRMNRTDGPLIDFTKYLGFVFPFNVLYITTPAGQAGTMKIIIGITDTDELFRIIDNRSQLSDTMQAILDELKGITAAGTQGSEITVGTSAVQVFAAGANRKGCSMQSKYTNSGIIYLGFENTVSSTIWWKQLMPGDDQAIDDYRGPVYAIASAAGQLLGWGEW